MKRYLSTAVALAALAALSLPLLGRSEEKAGGAWGTVKGVVLFANAQVPAQAPLKVDKDQGHCLDKGPLLSEELVVNPKNKGVRYAYVWLAPVEAGQKLPVHPSLANAAAKPVEIDQPCCQFVPHAVGVQEGQTLIVKNSSPIAHNVNYTGGSKNPGQNLLIPAGAQVQIKDLVAWHTPVSMKCNIHGWMSGWIRVFNHPYYVITDADGKWELKNAPAGNYRLVAWHESVGWVGGVDKNGQAVVIPAGGEVVVDLKFSK